MLIRTKNDKMAAQNRLYNYLKFGHMFLDKHYFDKAKK
jgi:hypothetical protein